MFIFQNVITGIRYIFLSVDMMTGRTSARVLLIVLIPRRRALSLQLTGVSFTSDNLEFSSFVLLFRASTYTTVRFDPLCLFRLNPNHRKLALSLFEVVALFSSSSAIYGRVHWRHQHVETASVMTAAAAAAVVVVVVAADAWRTGISFNILSPHTPF